MNQTKESIIRDLIDIMTANEGGAIRTLAMQISKSHSGKVTAIHHTPMPDESIPANYNLARFNIAAELTKRMMNDVPTAKAIIERYRPGIVTELAVNHPTDYNDPHHVAEVVDEWLGIQTINNQSKGSGFI
ncbi:hypothetical protein HMPREF9103_02377 [Lentilactobacillus parafarraginis F0439]|uniref:Uncharacterized protein n=1 Tax=Lentilactobacillus parafarraginis F0439 TaxID=797515 RepID=G9ZRL6_9LACO|nr:hypothetical protein [Lentilactobacillus parafarraginis]EHL96469.1 hypothetical protein HMPREF9103_02377 [Lentilactobacillus parafarraginis F0439]